MSDNNQIDKTMKEIVYELRVINAITIFNLVIILFIFALAFIGAFFWGLDA